MFSAQSSFGGDTVFAVVAPGIGEDIFAVKYHRGNKFSAVGMSCHDLDIAAAAVTWCGKLHFNLMYAVDINRQGIIQRIQLLFLNLILKHTHDLLI